MRGRFIQIRGILYFLGVLCIINGIIILTPLLTVIANWGYQDEGLNTVMAFVLPSLISLCVGLLLRTLFDYETMGSTSSMLLCTLSWILISAIGALPYVIGINSSYLNGYFEAMSGFTTTGITVFSGLDQMPRSIILWRALTQWLGGLGILSFFLVIIFRGSGAHNIYSAESHKIFSRRPVPGMFHTLKILWRIYTFFTLLSIISLSIEGMPLFDSICHSLTALSTGGFSPHDASIEYYKFAGYRNFKLFEYTLTFFMMLGGINFLVHYRVLTGDLKALWDNSEIRLWWKLILAFVVIIMVEHLYKSGLLSNIFQNGLRESSSEIEETFRYSIFQVVSIITTTGFGTKDIGSSFFPVLSRQLFLMMMVIGGCVGSTGGGIKVLRISILNKLMRRELFKIRVSDLASDGLVVDEKIVPNDEVHKVTSLFFYWIVFLIIGGGITALFTKLGIAESFSGMFSALGNIGPCYISGPEMINIHPVVKITYIVGMLAGRLELLPVLMLFSKKAWK